MRDPGDRVVTVTTRFKVVVRKDDIGGECSADVKKVGQIPTTKTSKVIRIEPFYRKFKIRYNI